MRNAAQHLQVVCSLGLAPAEAVAAIAEVARAVVPARWTRLSLHDPRTGRIVGSYNENAHNQLIAAERFEELARDSLSPFALIQDAWRAKTCGVFVERARAYASSMFHAECERPAGVHYVLDIMAAGAGAPVAGVGLLRAREDGPFTDADVQQLARLGPFIAHALRRPGAVAAGRPAYVSRRGTAVVDPAGRITHMDPTFALLMLALEELPFARGASSWRTAQALPAPCRTLLGGLPGRTTGNDARPPRTTVVTRAAVVALEASYLLPYEALRAGTAGDVEGSSILLSAEQLEPPAVGAARALRGLGASPAQVAVGVRLALGWSKARTADDLGVEPSSVEDARRKLYLRLGVTSAAELAEHVERAGRSVAASQSSYPSTRSRREGVRVEGSVHGEAGRSGTIRTPALPRSRRAP